MTSVEYNDLVDCLYRGHDFIFVYRGQHYFVEREEVVHNVYKVSENLETSEFFYEIPAETLTDRIDAFLDAKLFNGKAFNEIYAQIEIIDIE